MAISLSSLPSFLSLLRGLPIPGAKNGSSSSSLHPRAGEVEVALRIPEQRGSRAEPRIAGDREDRGSGSNRTSNEFVGGRGDDGCAA